jgi:hypothetical protein
MQGLSKTRAEGAQESSAFKSSQAPLNQTRWRPTLPDNLAFECEAEDHCETAPEAYRDIKPLLLQVCQSLGSHQEALRIYDPYYCAGSVIKHFADLGFPQVYNKCEFTCFLHLRPVP